jgi:hypothetical protein
MTTESTASETAAHQPIEINQQAHAARRAYLSAADGDVSPSAAACGIVIVLAALAALGVAGPPAPWLQQAPAERVYTAGVQATATVGCDETGDRPGVSAAPCAGAGPMAASAVPAAPEKPDVGNILGLRSAPAPAR